MKRSVIDANSIRKSLAKATALVAAAVASASCVVNADSIFVGNYEYVTNCVDSGIEVQKSPIAQIGTGMAYELGAGTW
jgi:hypothetical protein